MAGRMLRDCVARAVSTTVTTVALLVCAYVLSPFAGACALNTAIRNGDDAAMNRLVLWADVKQSLRQSILQRLGERALVRPDHPGWLASAKYSLTDAVAPLMVDYELDQRVSPEGFTTYMGPHSPKAEAARAAGIDPETMPSANVMKRIQRAVFIDLTHFQIDIVDRWDEAKVFRATLEFGDGLMWRLRRVEMLSLGEGA